MDILTLIIIWIFCGTIAGAIYNNKGRSGLSGFLAGVFLGPLGIILALASSSNKKVLEKRADQEIEQKITAGEMKKCPFCAEVIKAEAKVCRYCGKDLPETISTPTAQNS